MLIWTEADRFEAMRSFYVDVLGLKPRSDREGFVNFQWGSTRLTIGVHKEVSGSSGDPLRIMVNFAVEELDEIRHRLQVAGVKCLREPSPEPWGGGVATYSDPDGNTIQVMTGTS